MGVGASVMQLATADIPALHNDLTSAGAGTISVPTMTTFQKYGNIDIYCVAAGGGGVTASGSSGAGGGGGNFAGTSALRLGANTTIYYLVGGAGTAGIAGGNTWANINANSAATNTSWGALAVGGTGAASKTPGVAGTGNIGGTTFAGGTGTTSSSATGGGGAGDTSAASGQTAGTGVYIAGGAGGAGNSDGIAPGGGGGGGNSTGGKGGAGEAYIIIKK